MIFWVFFKHSTASALSEIVSLLKDFVEQTFVKSSEDVSVKMRGLGEEGVGSISLLACWRLIFHQREGIVEMTQLKSSHFRN